MTLQPKLQPYNFPPQKFSGSQHSLLASWWQTLTINKPEQLFSKLVGTLGLTGGMLLGCALPALSQNIFYWEADPNLPAGYTPSGGAEWNIDDTSRTYNNVDGSGIDINVQLLDPADQNLDSGNTGTANVATETNSTVFGGAGRLTLGMTSDNSSQEVSLIFTFSQPVLLENFLLGDIDSDGRSPAAQGFQDEAVFSAQDQNGNNVPVTLSRPPGFSDSNSNFSISGQTAVAIYESNVSRDVTPTNQAGHVLGNPQAAITQIRIDYSNGPDDDGVSNDHALMVGLEGGLFQFEPAPLDFSDAPPDGSTSPNGNGTTGYGEASHIVVDGTRLGANIDAETAAQSSAAADGDDNDSDGNDDDGVTIPSLMIGATATITADVAGAGGYLQGWIDWNSDGDFTDTGEQIAQDIQDNGTGDTDNTTGSISFDVNVPAGAVASTNTFARFRWSTTSGLDTTTAANDGEVEDYQIAIAPTHQTIEETASCTDLGGTLSNNNIFTPFDNGTFGSENGQPNQSPPDNAEPYPGAVLGGEYKHFYNIDHGDYGYVAYDVQRRNTFQHDNITDPVYGVTGRFFASDPDTDTPTLTATFSGLTPNQFYQYSFWAANSEPNPPSNNNVDVEVNGQKIYSTGDLPAIPDALEWKKHTVSFTNGASNSITIDLASTKTGAGGNDFYLDNIELRSCNFTVDYGDAPISYGEAIQTTIPTSPNIYLGAVAPDGENETPLGGDNGVGADGDDDTTNSGTDDEDAFTSLSNVPISGTYDLNNIPVNNTSGEDVTIHGWIDFDRDGQFSASEYQSATVANDDTTADLSWTIPNSTTAGASYARFRITPDVLLTDDASTADIDERSKDAAINGEVEDYPIAIASASLCPAARADLWFANDESGSVDDDEFDDALDFIYQISDSFVFDDNTGMKAGIIGWASAQPQTNPNNIIIPITDLFGDPDDSGLISDSSINVDGDNQGVRELYTSRQDLSNGTRLDLATNYLATLINGGNGRRTATPQVAIIMTDAFNFQITGNGGGSAWVSAANTLKNAGADGTSIVLVLIDAAAQAYNSSSNNPGDVKDIVDQVVGNGRLLIVPSYLDAADATKGYVEIVSQAICDSTTPTASDPGLLLVKRVTAINPGQPDETQFNDFVDDPNTDDDNHPLWPDSDEDPSSNTNLFLRGVLDGGRVKPGDEVEYTIYFLSNGDEDARDVQICDVVPDHLTYVKDSYGLEIGIALGFDLTTTQTAPNRTLTNLRNDDEGDFYGAGTAPPANLCKKVDDGNNLVTVDENNNDNGAIVVQPSSILPAATSAGQPANSYGFIRFRGKVK